jgi:hypothetical protein
MGGGFHLVKEKKGPAMGGGKMAGQNKKRSKRCKDATRAVCAGVIPLNYKLLNWGRKSNKKRRHPRGFVRNAERAPGTKIKFISVGAGVYGLAVWRGWEKLGHCL